MTGAGRAAVEATETGGGQTGPPTTITFNRPHAKGGEFGYIQQAIENQHLSGNGPFTTRCAHWLENRVGCSHALLTPSCTSALEIASVLAELGPEDEVIMPSFTFVSTANAVVLRATD